MFAPFGSLNSIRRRRKRNQSRSKSVAFDRDSLTSTTATASDQMSLAVGEQDSSAMVALHKYHSSTAQMSDDDVNDLSASFPAADHSSSSESSDLLHPTNSSLTTSETSFSSTGSDFVLGGDNDEDDSVSSLGEPKELEQLLQSAAHTYDFHDEDAPNVSPMVFRNLRITYLLVTLVIMLADGLQGTYVVVFSSLV